MTRASSRWRDRGGGWVAAQFVVILLIVVAWTLPPRIHSGALHAIGLALAVAGTGLALWAARTLGGSFTAFPRPREGAALVTSGPFRFVRHPIYSGGILVFVGFSLRFSWVGVFLALGLGVLWAAKARVEERYLAARFAEYDAYRRRVRRRLLPLVY
jgi:protein-S-isoprenylcysteine O-methyltransferase